MNSEEIARERKTPYEPGLRPDVYARDPQPPEDRRGPSPGDRQSFIPSAFDASFQGSSLSSIRPDLELTVTGTVVCVNEAHRWYRVRYQTPDGGVHHECFKY